jgi:hypothetical protein
MVSQNTHTARAHRIVSTVRFLLAKCARSGRESATRARTAIQWHQSCTFRTAELSFAQHTARAPRPWKIAKIRLFRSISPIDHVKSPSLHASRSDLPYGREQHLQQTRVERTEFFSNLKKKSSVPFYTERSWCTVVWKF